MINASAAPPTQLILYRRIETERKNKRKAKRESFFGWLEHVEREVETENENILLKHQQAKHNGHEKHNKKSISS